MSSLIVWPLLSASFDMSVSGSNRLAASRTVTEKDTLLPSRSKKSGLAGRVGVGVTLTMWPVPNISGTLNGALYHPAPFGGADALANENARNGALNEILSCAC